MGRIAFVFPGQGAQAPGMGHSLYETSPAARAVFDLADTVREGTSAQCFSGTAEELQETINTQPCLYVVEMAAAAAVQELGITPELTAGFSLGELSALTCAGAIDPENGLRLVSRRAALMQEAAQKHDTAMAAVMKLTREEIERLCDTYPNIYPVNYNCPGQISVSGDTREMVTFAEAVKEAGGRAKILKVSGAFHSPYMTEAAEGFEQVLEEVTFAAPKFPVYSDYTARPYENIKEALAAQIDHPVQWEEIIRHMIGQGTDTFIELGPGKTLTGLIKRIDENVRLFNVNEAQDLEKLRQEL